MIKRLSHWLVMNAKAWLILILLGLFILFSLVIMPYGQTLMGSAAEETGLIDMTFGADPEKLFEKVDSYGEHGRQVYRVFTLTADLAYPIVYSLFFSLATTYLFRRTFSTRSWTQRLNLLPFTALIFDLLENLGIAGLVSTYPQRLTWLAILTVIFNSLKWILVGCSLVLLLVGLVRSLIPVKSKS